MYQETWLRAILDFVAHGYVIVRRDRIEGGGGGCATLIRQGIPYRVLEKGAQQEYIVMEVWEGGEEVIIINYHNPYQKLEISSLVRLQGLDRRKVVWCADFNAHSTM